MRVKKIAKFILTVGLFFGVQFGSVHRAVAMDTFGLGQKILPVCLVYLNPGGAILNIWSNVGQADDSYVLKFLDEKSRELPLDQKFFSRYVEKSKRDIIRRNKTESTQFFTKNNLLEEVKTVV